MLFSPRLIFVLLYLQTSSPRLEFAHTLLCLKRDLRHCNSSRLNFTHLHRVRKERKWGRIFPCIKYQKYSIVFDFYVYCEMTWTVYNNLVFRIHKIWITALHRRWPDSSNFATNMLPVTVIEFSVYTLLGALFGTLLYGILEPVVTDLTKPAQTIRFQL